MTRNVSLRAFFGLAGIVVIGLAAAACASPTGPDALVAAPSSSSAAPAPTRTTASKPTPKPRPKPKFHPKPKPRPKRAPVTTHPHTSAPPPAPVTTHAPAPAPPTTHAAPKPAPKPANCDPSYPDTCLHDGIGDYDCSSGSGNGPNYANGPLTVRPPDPFGLDADHDGVGCERG